MTGPPLTLPSRPPHVITGRPPAPAGFAVRTESAMSAVRPRPPRRRDRPIPPRGRFADDRPIRDRLAGERVVRNLRRLPRKLAVGRRRAVDRLRERAARGDGPAVLERTEEQNRDLTRRLYDGPAGAVLALASAMSLHEPLIGALLRGGSAGRDRRPRFDVTRFRDVLDVGSGAGQILGHLIREARPDARLTAFDLSDRMLRRSRKRMAPKCADARRPEPDYVAGDLLRMPFADGSFDCVTAGWVLEHLTDPAPGLAEMARVLRPGGRLLLLCTADNVTGQWNSRTWKCRTYGRAELAGACAAAGLPWVRRHHLSPVHRALKFGGIIAECERIAGPAAPRPR